MNFVDLFLGVLLAVLPAMFVAVALVRRGKVKAHARVMATCYVVFLLAVIAFEYEVHFGEGTPPLQRVPLVIHLCFAFPCAFVWTWQVAKAKQAFTDAAVHRRRGKLLMGLLTLTVATGVWLYAVSF